MNIWRMNKEMGEKKSIRKIKVSIKYKLRYCGQPRDQKNT